MSICMLEGFWTSGVDYAIYNFCESLLSESRFAQYTEWLNGVLTTFLWKHLIQCMHVTCIVWFSTLQLTFYFTSILCATELQIRWSKPSHASFILITVLIVTISHGTFSSQFRCLSGQFFPLSDQSQLIMYNAILLFNSMYVLTFSVVYYEHCDLHCSLACLDS